MFSTPTGALAPEPFQLWFSVSAVVRYVSSRPVVAFSEARPPRGFAAPAFVNSPPTSSRSPTSAMSLTPELNAGGTNEVTREPSATLISATLRRVVPFTELNRPAMYAVPAVGPAMIAVTSSSRTGAKPGSTSPVALSNASR
jgi:hypothetical protein